MLILFTLVAADIEMVKVGIGAAILGILIGLCLVAVRSSRVEFRKPNIVVLSFCSLRKAELATFSEGGEKSLTPHLQKILDKSYIFKNAFSRYGWTNPAMYMLDEISPRFFLDHGYELVGNEAQGRLFRIPSDVVHYGPSDPTPANFSHFYQLPLGYLKSLWLQPRIHPFFSYIHVKYMHYPYIDRVNKAAKWDRFLDPVERERISGLFNGNKAKGSLPMRLILTGDPKQLGTSASPDEEFNDLYPTFSDEAILSLWKSEPTYHEDLTLIKKVYRAALVDWDDFFTPLFTLFGDQRLIENTIIIFTGDHGEAMMEHDHLGHATDVYDETITFPLAVHFPHSDLRKSKIIKSQFFQGSMVDMIRGFVDGSLTEDNFEEKMLSLPKNEMIISRNCSNTQQSVRWKNRWKYIKDEIKGDRLYDLLTDPTETVNQIDHNHEVATKLKFYLIDHADEFTSIVDFSPCQKAS